MKCDTILKQVCSELAEDIDSEVCDQLRRHLQTCPACAGQIAAMRTAIHLYQGLGEQEVPAPIHERLAALLKLEEGRPR